MGIPLASDKMVTLYRIKMTILKGPKRFHYWKVLNKQLKKDQPLATSKRLYYLKFKITKAYVKSDKSFLYTLHM